MNPGMPMGSYAPPLPGAVDAGDIPQEGDWGREPIVDGSKLYKGVLWALLIEGIVAFLLYAAWWLCHPRK